MAVATAPAPSKPQAPVITPNQLIGMSPSQRAAFLDEAYPDPKSRAAAQQQYTDMRADLNRQYMEGTLPKWAICPPSGSAGTFNTYATGTTLYWNLPTASGAFCTDLLFEVNVSLAFAAGASAVYAANAAAPYSLFSEIRLVFGSGNQVRTIPYITKILFPTRGYDRSLPSKALQNANATIDSNIVGTTAVAAGNQTWAMYFRIPLAALHASSPAGAIPMMGTGTQAQIQMDCCATLLGPDPLTNIAAVVSGTGHAITVNGGSTVKCFALYRDGTNFGGPKAMYLDLDGEPTAQYYIDTPLNGLSAGVMNRQRIQTLLKHYKVINIVIDGQQSNKFSAVTNLAGFEFDEDAVAQNKLLAFGAGTNNLDIYLYYEWMRHTFAQDLDEGVILWASGAERNQQNPSNGTGQQVLNMLPNGGWTDINWAVQPTAVGGVANISTRVVTLLVSENPQGLVLV